MEPVQFLKNSLSSAQKKKLKTFYYRTKFTLETLPQVPRCAMNRLFFKGKLVAKYDKLNLGCSTLRLPGFLNMDVRPTRAVDIAHDCSDLSVFPDKSFSTVFSHAFFEHVFMDQRQACLKSVFHVLKDQGTVVFLGLPDFKKIALAYLNAETNTPNEKFDLIEVYKYTHGYPEMAPAWWIEQLHKSLFDQDTIEELLKTAGFSHYSIFNYSFREEKIPLNLGFVGFKSQPATLPDQPWLSHFLAGYTEAVNGQSIQILKQV